MLSITKYFEFESAHKLPFYRGKCNNLHGHTYKMEIEIDGPATRKKPPDGMILDFVDLKSLVQTHIIDKYDHTMLNYIVENPTAENLVEEIVKTLQGVFKKNLVRVRLWETSNSYAEWKRDESK